MASSSLQPAAVVYRRIADKFTPTTPYRRAVRSLVVPAKLPKVPIAIEINDSQRVFDLRSDGIADGLLTSTGVARAQLRIRTICWPPPIALICLALRTVLHAFPQFVGISQGRRLRYMLAWDHAPCRAVSGVCHRAADWRR